jgi:hypothetical protein
MFMMKEEMCEDICASSLPHLNVKKKSENGVWLVGFIFVSFELMVGGNWDGRTY